MILHRVLLLCYPPVQYPTFTSLEDFHSVANVAKKYCIESFEGIEAVLVKSSDLIENYPLQVYAIGIRFHMREVCRVAARKYIETPLSANSADSVFELDGLSAKDLYRLVHYQRRCIEAAKRSVFACDRYGDPMAVYLPWVSDFYYHFRNNFPDVNSTLIHCFHECQGKLHRIEVTQPDNLDYAVHGWVLSYLQGLASSMEHTLSASNVWLDELLEPLKRAALKCGHWDESSSIEISAFVKYVERVVEEAIEKVKISQTRALNPLISLDSLGGAYY